MAQVDSRAVGTETLRHAQSGPSDAPQKRVYRLRKRARGVSGVYLPTFSFFIEFHAWTVPGIDQRLTWCWVPHDPKHLQNGPFLGRTPSERLLQNPRRDLLLYHSLFAITGTFGRFVRWNRKLRSGILIESPFSGCSRVGTLTAEAVKGHCLDVLSLDLSHTSVTPASLAGVLQNCRRLEKLKAAAIKDWVRVH